MSERIAAVTGASRGIGHATAVELAKAGSRVFALARTAADLDELARKWPGVMPVVLDITDDASRRAAAAAIFEATDGYGVDVLINNAGYGQMGAVEEVTPDELRRQFDVNLFGLHAFAVPFIPPMREHGRGWIVNVSSIAGRISTPFMGAYSASKFALEGLSDALRLELAPFGVHVIVIEPGPIRTDFDSVAPARPEASSPYYELERQSQGAHAANNLFELPPVAVARTIMQALGSEHPRARYTVTIPARLGTVAYHVVPDAVRDWAMSRAMKLRK